jgi:hypothetical protein
MAFCKVTLLVGKSLVIISWLAEDTCVMVWSMFLIWNEQKANKIPIKKDIPFLLLFFPSTFGQTG